MTQAEIDKIIDNQCILDRKLNRILEKLESTIHNQSVLEQYHLDLKEKIKRIERKMS
nr:hypothetical protein [uncultured Draconibacterium sp.]